MPGFNGIGPRGMGPMTGRGMGYCAQPGAYPYGYPQQPVPPSGYPYPPAGETPPAMSSYPFVYGRPRWGLRFGGRGRGGRGPWGW